MNKYILAAMYSASVLLSVPAHANHRSEHRHEARDISQDTRIEAKAKKKVCYVKDH